MPTPSRELHCFGNYCLAAVSTNNALVALKCLKHPRVDCGVSLSLSVQFLVKNKVITLGDLTEVPQAFTWNNKVIFPVFRYSPGVQCCPHLFDFYRSILLMIFLICVISFPSVSLCASRISFRTTFFDGFQKHQQDWGLPQTDPQLPLGFPDNITYWKDRGKFGWDNNFQTCRKWQKTFYYWDLVYHERCVTLSYVQKSSIFFQPEWDLCLVKGKNKRRKDQVQFSMRHSTVSCLILVCNILISSQNGSIWDKKRQQWHPCINSVSMLPFHWGISQPR